MVARRREKEPDQRQVERQGEGEDFLGVELSVPVALVGPLDGGDARLGEPLAQEPFEGAGGLFLSPAASSRAAWKL